MWAPIITCIVGFSLFAAAAVWRPQGARLFFGFFFLACGLGINLAFTVLAPEGVSSMATNAYLPLAKTFFEGPVAANPVLWMIPVILLEATVGLALLSKGRLARFGLLSGAAFISALALVGPEMIPNLILAGSMVWLATRPLERSFLDSIRRLRNRRAQEQR